MINNTNWEPKLQATKGPEFANALFSELRRKGFVRSDLYSEFLKQLPDISSVGSAYITYQIQEEQKRTLDYFCSNITELVKQSNLESKIFVTTQEKRIFNLQAIDMIGKLSEVASRNAVSIGACGKSIGLKDNIILDTMDLSFQISCNALESFSSSLDHSNKDLTPSLDVCKQTIRDMKIVCNDIIAAKEKSPPLLEQKVDTKPIKQFRI